MDGLWRDLGIRRNLLALFTLIGQEHVRRSTKQIMLFLGKDSLVLGPLGENIGEQ